MKKIIPPPYKACAILILALIFNFLPFNKALAQACSTSPPCPNDVNKMIYSLSGTPITWAESTTAHCNGEQITCFSNQYGLSLTPSNIFGQEFNIRSDGSRIGQLTLGDYVYGAAPTPYRFNFIGDDISSLFSPLASVPKLTGFHNFDNNISTVFGSYKNDQTNSGDPINPVIFWENNSSEGTTSRLRFLNKAYIGGFQVTTEWGTLLENGNWGLGNIAPNSKLEVGGGLYVSNLSTTTLTAPPGFIYSNGPIIIGDENFISTVPNNVFIATQPGTRTALGIDNPYAFLHVHSPTTGPSAGLDDFKLTDQATGATASDGFSLNISGSNVDFTNYENGNMRFSTNGTAVRMTIDNSGNVLIGGTTAHKLLTVYGDATKTAGGTAWAVFSDKRLKKEIRKFEGGLDEILKINPVWFKYNGLLGTNSKNQEVGVLAQELLEISPYMVEEYFDSTFGNFYGVNNGAMTYLLINSVKQLSRQNNDLQHKLDLIQDQISEIVKDKMNGNFKDERSVRPEMKQNTPNPFDNNTTIGYFLPANIKDASIRIFDQNDNTLKTFKIDKNGFGEVIFEYEGKISSALLYYSLIISNTIIETRKMLHQ